MAKRLIRTEKWTSNKPKLPAYISVWLALKSNESLGLRKIKRETSFFDTENIDLKRWYRYYEDIQFALDDCFDSFSNFLKLSGLDDLDGILFQTFDFFKSEPEQQAIKLEKIGIQSENVQRQL